MSEVRLDQVLARLPSGLPVPVGCWLVGRVANAIAAQPRAVPPTDVRIREDGGVRVAPPAHDEPPFAYRAPEVIRGGAHSPRAAVFGLGALLVEALTGKAPFARGSDLETRIAVVEEEVAPLVGRVAQASAALDALVGRALAKAAEDRFGTTVELAERLDAFLDEELHEVGPEDLVKAVRAALAGGDPWSPAPSAERTPAAPRAAGPPASAAPRAAGPPASAAPRAAAAPRGTPAPERRPTAGRATPPPASTVVAKPARRPPSAAARPGSPPAGGAAGLDESAIAGAELDLRPQGRRTSAPAKPRLDQDVVRLGDPLQEAGRAGITGAALTDAGPAPARRPRTARAAPAVLDIDERALQRERQRPATLVEDEPPPEPGPNWVLRVAVALLSLLAAAIAYQFLLRPLLKG